MGEENVSFGAELRRLRTEAGWSLADLAEAVHYSKSHLSKVETGRKSPSADLARACDTALGAEGRLAALVRGRRPTTRSGASGPPLPAAGPPLSPPHAFALGAGALLGLGPSGKEPPAFLGSADVLTAFRSMFDQARVLGQRTGPTLVLPTVAAQAHALTRLARGAKPKLAVPALLLASRFAEYGGWLAQEAGNSHGALWWTKHAVDLAAQAGDQEMRAQALIRRACVAMYAHDGLHTVALAQQAYAIAPSPRLRAMASEREAQGHALTGDYDQCRRALDRAEKEAAHETAEPSDRPLLGVDSAEPLAVVTGWCMHDLGRPAEAAEILDRELRDPPHRGAPGSGSGCGVRCARRRRQPGTRLHPHTACWRSSPPWTPRPSPTTSANSRAPSPAGTTTRQSGTSTPAGPGAASARCER